MRPVEFNNSGRINYQQKNAIRITYCVFNIIKEVVRSSGVETYLGLDSTL